MAEPSEGGRGRPRKRPAAKKEKCTILLSVEASQRLDIHATMLDMDRSELVEKLIADHLRRFVVSDRGAPEGVESELVAEGRGSASVRA
jgi:hypothetical protein